MSFFQKIRASLARFMYGRYGNDQFNLFLCVLILILYVLGLFLSRVPVAGVLLQNLPTAVWIWILWRMLSRNYERRRRENAWFLGWWGPLTAGVRSRQNRMRDKEHKYFTCSACGTVCRVPRGRGKILITCPKCGREIRGKS